MHPSIESWQLACDLVQKERPRLDKYLQWYPFSKLSRDDWEAIKSVSFYSTYIKDGSFILVESMRFITKGYMQKQGVTLRASTLVAPILFLYLLAFGLEYVRIFDDPRDEGICLYSGDLKQQWIHYRKSYQAFVETKQFCSEEYDHCIKTDITDFFGSINVDALLTKMQNQSAEQFSSTDALFIRGLLLYCGNGGFPTIQNHPTLSFLATQVYLGDIDVSLRERLSRLSGITSFELVRYVDDLFIFFNLEDESDLIAVSHAIMNVYADLLHKHGLALKQEKLKVLTPDEVRTSAVTISAVDFTGSDVDTDLNIEDAAVVGLFSSIAEAIEEGDYSQDVLLSSIEEYFSQENLAVPAIMLFRQCLYKMPQVFQSERVVSAINHVLTKGNIGFTFNTSELVLCILHTRDEVLVKRMLNNLFSAERDGMWSSLDCVVALTYLQQRGMKHADLLALLKRQDSGLGQYCSAYCVGNFSQAVITPAEKRLIGLIQEDIPSKIQYISYLQNDRTDNSFEKASYFRSFFDRVASYIFQKKKDRKKITWLYKEPDLKTLFKDIDGSAAILRAAADVRQNNPLIHASSKMIDTPTYKTELDKTVESLRILLDDEIANLPDSSDQDE